MVPAHRVLVVSPFVLGCCETAVFFTPAHFFSGNLVSGMFCCIYSTIFWNTLEHWSQRFWDFWRFLGSSDVKIMHELCNTFYCCMGRRNTRNRGDFWYFFGPDSNKRCYITHAWFLRDQTSPCCSPVNRAVKKYGIFFQDSLGLRVDPSAAGLETEGEFWNDLIIRWSIIRDTHIQKPCPKHDCEATQSRHTSGLLIYWYLPYITKIFFVDNDFHHLSTRFSKTFLKSTIK